MYLCCPLVDREEPWFVRCTSEPPDLQLNLLLTSRRTAPETQKKKNNNFIIFLHLIILQFIFNPALLTGSYDIFYILHLSLIFLGWFRDASQNKRTSRKHGVTWNSQHLSTGRRPECRWRPAAPASSVGQTGEAEHLELHTRVLAVFRSTSCT